ncbi:MAG: hypothetical protein ABIK97_06165, partial [candidate division WOR-3 bacterium]
MIYIILLILLGIIIFLILYLLLKKESGIKSSEFLQLLQEQISSLRQEMSQNFATFLNSLQQTTGQVNTRL